MLEDDALSVMETFFSSPNLSNHKGKTSKIFKISEPIKIEDIILKLTRYSNNQLIIGKLSRAGSHNISKIYE